MVLSDVTFRATSAPRCLAIFAGTPFAMAAGLHGAIAYVVEQRTGDAVVRGSLGERVDEFEIVIREDVVVPLVEIFAGVAHAYIATRMTSTFPLNNLDDHYLGGHVGNVDRSVDHISDGVTTCGHYASLLSDDDASQ
jgi:hypothetical protein